MKKKNASDRGPSSGGDSRFLRGNRTGGTRFDGGRGSPFRFFGKGTGSEAESGSGSYDPGVNIVYTIYPEPQFPDLEKTGAVFTYMTWLSNQTVLPAYYEVTLKQKRTRDEDSAKMLDLIHNSINYDFGDLFTRIRFYLVQAYDSGSYERTVGTAIKKLTKELNKLQDKLKNLD